MLLKIKYTTEILFEYAGYACINIQSVKTRRKTDGDWYEDGVTPALSLAIYRTCDWQLKQAHSDHKVSCTVFHPLIAERPRSRNASRAISGKSYGSKGVYSYICPDLVKEFNKHDTEA